MAKPPVKRRKASLKEQVALTLREQQAKMERGADANFEKLGKKIPKVIESTRRRRSQGHYVQPSTVRIPNITKFGKQFIITFPFRIVGRKTNKYVAKLGGLGHDSPVVVGVCPLKKAGSESSYVHNIAELNIGFEKNAVVIESMQGRVSQAVLDRFRQAAGKPALNCLIEFVEMHAKKCGFSQTKISAPENLLYFRFPEILEGCPNSELDTYWSQMHTGKLIEFGGKIGEKVREIRERMKKLYETVAGNMGYTRQDKYFVKNL